MEVVRALDAQGWSMSLHPAGPKLTIWCGACHRSWQDRPAGSSSRKIYSRCVYCGVVNDTGLVVD